MPDVAANLVVTFDLDGDDLRAVALASGRRGAASYAEARAWLRAQVARALRSARARLAEDDALAAAQSRQLKLPDTGRDG